MNPSSTNFLPAAKDDPVALCLAGHISAPVMLARLVLSGVPDAAIEQRLREAAPLLVFFHEHAASLRRLRRIARQVDHAPPVDPRRIAEQFDAAVARAPEASVAAYSLGEPELLAAATAELTGWLRHRRLFVPGMDVLDLGCGFGRIAAAVAPHAASVLGLDVSAGMIAEARRRHGTIPHLRFAPAPGAGLAMLADAAFDLVLTVDSFPYLLQAGEIVARQHVADIARVLRPGGRFAIFNLSYGPDPAADAARVAAWAAASGLAAACNDPAPFTLWDAPAFVFARRYEIVRGGTTALPPRPDTYLQQSEGPP